MAKFKIHDLVVSVGRGRRAATALRAREAAAAGGEPMQTDGDTAAECGGTGWLGATDAVFACLNGPSLPPPPPPDCAGSDKPPAAAVACQGGATIIQSCAGSGHPARQLPIGAMNEEELDLLRRRLEVRRAELHRAGRTGN